MSRVSEILEIARVLCPDYATDRCVKGCYAYDNGCTVRENASAVYDANYRRVPVEQAESEDKE